MKSHGKPAVDREKGFSLIELMVVLVVIALLTSIVIPVFDRAMDRAHRASVASVARDFYSALTRYNADNGTFPATIDLFTFAPLSTDGYLDNTESMVSKLFDDQVWFYVGVSGEEFFGVLRSKGDMWGIFVVCRTNRWGGDPGVWYDGAYYYDWTTGQLVPVSEAT